MDCLALVGEEAEEVGVDAPDEGVLGVLGVLGFVRTPLDDNESALLFNER